MTLTRPYHIKADNDLQWVLEYKASGDLDALAHLYQTYMPMVYGVALKYFKDENRSKDAVMDIFELLINKVKTQSITYFKSWLYTLSKNYCLMELRQSKNNIVEIRNDIMEFEPFLHHNESDDKERRLSILENCIKTLNIEQRASISLFYLQEKCYQEVAEETGYELKKVKSYIQNGKRNLKMCMEQRSE